MKIPNDDGISRITKGWFDAFGLRAGWQQATALPRRLLLNGSGACKYLFLPERLLTSFLMNFTLLVGTAV